MIQSWRYYNTQTENTVHVAQSTELSSSMHKHLFFYNLLIYKYLIIIQNSNQHSHFKWKMWVKLSFLNKHCHQWFKTNYPSAAVTTQLASVVLNLQALLYNYYFIPSSRQSMYVTWTSCFQDCDGDGWIDCEDYARIHYMGGRQCTLHMQHLGYYKVFKECHKSIQQLTAWLDGTDLKCNQNLSHKT
jgi:hypothetical protein